MDLPLFPLHVVLFPGRPLPLHLFEPRYRAMLRDCLDSDRRFGVVAIRSGREVGTDWKLAQDGETGEARDGHDISVIHRVGTATAIRTVAERPDGRYDIITVGDGRFRIVKPLHDRPYLRAEVEPIEEPEPGAPAQVAARELREVLIPYLRELGVPEEFCSQLPTDPVGLSFAAASALQIEVSVQQRLLEMGSCAERLRAATALIRRESSLSRHLGLVGSFRPPGPGGAQLN